jgi:formylglycine-generating enzyme required for sulfatase activity
VAGSAPVALRAVLIARPEYRLLATPPVALNSMTDLADGLRHGYGAQVTVLDQRFLASPATATAAVSKRLAEPADALLLAVSGHVARFARRGGDLWALALPGSIPGRPGSMLRLDTLVDAAAASSRRRPLVICLDLATLPGRSDTEEPSAADLSSALATGWSAGPERTTTLMVTLDHSETAAGTVGLHALERTLASLACAGDEALPGQIAAEAAGFARTLGADTHTVRADSEARLRPLRRGPALPQYIHDDLFAPDHGSRMDAALELAALADTGHPDAARALTHLATHDRAPAVRAYADLLARRTTQPSLQILHATGQIPDATYTAAKQDVSLPELLAQPAGAVPVGVDAPDGEPADQPRHLVDLAPFSLARTLVTNRQYLAYLIATGGPCPDHWATATDLWHDADHPVVMVSFHDALGYCAWLTARLREAGRLTEHEQITLPSEAQWEAAAGNGRGDHHPWGQHPDPARCNIRATGIGRPSPVGAFSPHGDNTTGVADLIGNVWEWTNSAWGASYRQPAHRYPYQPSDGRENPHTPGVRRVIRGGAFYYATDCANSHTRNRIPPGTRHPGGGFRVAAVTLTKAVTP